MVASLTTIRFLQGSLALVVLCLSAFVAHWYNTETLLASPWEVNLLVAAPVISILSLLYLEGAPRFAAKAPKTNPLASLALELTNTACYLTGFVAVSLFLNRMLFCHGIVCSAARADAAVVALACSAWMASLVPAARGVLRSQRAGIWLPAPELPGAAQPQASEKMAVAQAGTSAV